MFLSLLFALLPAVEVVPAAHPAEAPIRLTINNDRRFNPGDPVHVRVETGRDGHLLVLHYMPAGDVKVLFPLAPADLSAVQGGRRYEIRDESTAQSFLAAGRGPGLILAVLTEDPFRLDAFTAAGEWAAGALAIPRDTRDPESDLVALVQRMVSPKGFDYDVLDYAVFGTVASDDAGADIPAWWSPTYVMAGGWGGDCFGCGYWGPGGVVIGINVGWGWGWGGYYPPYYTGWPCCGYGWAGYGYGYGYGWGYGGYYPPYYPGGGGGYGHYGPGAAIVGRPRGYNVIPLDQGGGRPRSVDGGAAAGTRSVSERGARPAAPPARRARGGESGEARQGGGGSGAAARPQGGSNGGSSNPSGGQPREPQRARPRSGRPPTEDLRIASGPNIETARPEGRTQQGWVRVEDALPAARSREGITRNSAFIDRARAGGIERAGRVDFGSNRIDMAPARRVSRPEMSGATRARGDWQRGGQTPRAAMPQPLRGGNEGRSARPLGGGSGAGGGRVSRPSGGGGQMSRPSGGGGGRSRGRP